MTNTSKDNRRDAVPIRSHPYQGPSDGEFCSYDYGDFYVIDFCNMPRSAHVNGDQDDH